MNQLTTAQLKVIQTWTEQRDALLREIGIYTTQLDGLQNSTKEAAASLTDIQHQISECRGHIETLLALEERMRGSVPNDIAELEVRKTRLQGECTELDIRIAAGMHQYGVITTAVANLESAHKTMEDQAAIVGRVVGEIIQTSQVHTSEMKTIMENVRTVAVQVIEKSDKNIAQADIVLNKLTMHIIDRQRPIPVRRTYPIGHPHAPTQE